MQCVSSNKVILLLGYTELPDRAHARWRDSALCKSTVSLDNSVTSEPGGHQSSHSFPHKPLNEGLDLHKD